MPTVEFKLEGAGKIPREYDAISKAAGGAGDAQQGFGTALESALTKTDDLKDKFDETNTAKDSLIGLETLQSIGSFADRWGLVENALALITAEMEHQQDLIDKRAAAQIDISTSRNSVLAELGGGRSDAENQAVLDQAAQDAAAAGVSVKVYNVGYAEALKHSGGNVEVARQATFQTAQFLPGQGGNIGDVAGSLVDLSAATGSPDARTNLGLAAVVGQLSGIINPAEVAPDLANSLNVTGDTRSGSALFAALARLGGDHTGDDTGKALEKIGGQLADFEGTSGLGDLASQITALQQDPELAARFFAPTKDGGGGATNPILRQLLTDPTSQTARLYQQNLGLIPDAAGLATAGQESIDVFDANEFNRTGQRVQAAKNLDTKIDQGATASRALTREELTILTEKIASGPLDNTSARIAFASKGDGVVGTSPETAIRLVEQAKLDLLKEERGGNLSTGFRHLGLDELSPDERNKYEAYDQYIQKLEQLQNEARESQDKVAGILQGISDKMEGGGVLVGTNE